jgi:hypothetical protein
MENDTAGDGGLQRSGIPQGVALGWYIAPLQGLPLALAQAAPVTGHGGPAQREWPGSAGGEAGQGVSGRMVCRLRAGLRVGAPRLHLVPTPCLHTLSLYASSPHFVPHITGHGGLVLQEWPGAAGRGAGRFLVLVLVLVLDPRYCRDCRHYRDCRRAGQASACPRTRGRADARPSRGCGHGVWFGALHAASPARAPQNAL